MTESRAPRTSEKPPDTRYLSSTARSVERRVIALQKGVLQSESWAVSTLAKLRRAAGALPGQDFESWGIVAETISDELGHGTAATSRRENAAHLALTLYATHQQSRDQGMHRTGPSLGTAVRLLAATQGGDTGESRPPVLRRFQALGTAEGLPEIAHHARAIVAQLRSESIALDYGLLAQHLIRVQDPFQVSRVRLAWGRDFHRTSRTSDLSSGEPSAHTTEGDEA